MEWLLAAFFFLCVAPVLLAVVFSWSYRETAIAAQLAREFDLNNQDNHLQKPGLSVQLRRVANTGSGSSRTFVMDYRGKLPQDTPSTLSLQSEGADTGERARRGERECETGDVDFDDSFWIGGKSTDYLTPDRRTLLLEVFSLLPEARIGDGQISGTQAYTQSPWGWSQLKQTLQNVERLQKDLSHPPTLLRRQPVGWVASKKRREYAGWFFLAGPLTLASSAGYCAMVPMTASQLDFWCALSFALTGCFLLHCGICLRTGSARALRSFRAVQVGSGVSLLLMIPAWRTALGAMGVTTLILVAAGLAYGLDRAFSAMSRLRLSR